MKRTYRRRRDCLPLRCLPGGTPPVRQNRRRIRFGGVCRRCVRVDVDGQRPLGRTLPRRTRFDDSESEHSTNVLLVDLGEPSGIRQSARIRFVIVLERRFGRVRDPSPVLSAIKLDGEFAGFGVSLAPVAATAENSAVGLGIGISLNSNAMARKNSQRACDFCLGARAKDLPILRQACVAL